MVVGYTTRNAVARGSHEPTLSVVHVHSFTEGKGEAKRIFTGLLASHTYTTQNLRNFIHKTIRNNNPTEFEKIRNGTWTDPKTNKQVSIADPT